MKLHYAIVFVSDMGRSLEFYRDILGLPLKFETPEWTEFATEGVTLALHISEPATGPIGQRPIAGQSQLGFQVADLDACHEDLVAKGVTCLRPPTEEFGTRLARYADPDGLRLTVSEGRK